MNKESIQLTAKDILDQDFKVGMRGYNQNEVDKFLDTVIQDYEAFQKKVAQLEKENKQLKDDLTKRSERPMSGQAARAVNAPATGNTNYDILQRLSNLEKQVFGNKMNELDG